MILALALDKGICDIKVTLEYRNEEITHAIEFHL